MDSSAVAIWTLPCFFGASEGKLASPSPDGSTAPGILCSVGVREWGAVEQMKRRMVRRSMNATYLHKSPSVQVPGIGNSACMLIRILGGLYLLVRGDKFDLN
jgi:hypothetical protein